MEESDSVHAPRAPLGGTAERSSGGDDECRCPSSTSAQRARKHASFRLPEGFQHRDVAPVACLQPQGGAHRSGTTNGVGCLCASTVSSSLHPLVLLRRPHSASSVTPLSKREPARQFWLPHTSDGTHTAPSLAFSVSCGRPQSARVWTKGRVSAPASLGGTSSLRNCGHANVANCPRLGDEMAVSLNSRCSSAVCWTSCRAACAGRCFVAELPHQGTVNGCPLFVGRRQEVRPARSARLVRSEHAGSSGCSLRGGRRDPTKTSRRPVWERRAFLRLAACTALPSPRRPTNHGFSFVEHVSVMVSPAREEIGRKYLPGRLQKVPAKSPRCQRSLSFPSPFSTLGPRQRARDGGQQTRRVTGAAAWCARRASAAPGSASSRCSCPPDSAPARRRTQRAKSRQGMALSSQTMIKGPWSAEVRPDSGAGHMPPMVVGHAPRARIGGSHALGRVPGHDPLPETARRARRARTGASRGTPGASVVARSPVLSGGPTPRPRVLSQSRGLGGDRAAVLFRYRRRMSS